MKFLQHPNLPQNKVSLAVIAAGNCEIKAALESKGITVIEVIAHKSLSKPVASHADMQLHDMGGGRVVAAKAADALIRKLEELGFSVEKQELSAKYPGDVALNCFLLGKNLFCNQKGTSKLLLNNYQSIGAGIVNIKQGYAKCSVCIVDENSIITADPGIAEAATLQGIDVLRIKSGAVSLPGYESGFIGGCCGLIAQDKLAFTGNLSRHPDAERIKAFCVSKGVGTVELADSELIDIGGILPLAIY